MEKNSNTYSDNLKFAPVIIPTLNRFEHFKRCLETLEKCTGASMTDVFVGLDFPPSDRYKEGWKRIDEYLREKENNHNFHKLVVIRREKNYGINGPHSNFNQLIDHVYKTYDRFISSEDDNEFSPNFLDYMNQNLEAYKDDPKVIAVCGYSYPIEWKVSDGATCLKENVSVPMFGIGFWKDKRLAYTKELREGIVLDSLYEVIRTGKHRKLTDPGKIEYFNATCKSIFIKKRADNAYCRSSDFTVRLYLTIADKYVISPVISKVRNHGFDGTGTMCQAITDNFGDTAGTYDYEHQPIDTDETFELKADTLKADEENRIRMNRFDYRSSEEMAETNRLIKLCETLGPWAAKLYGLMAIPKKSFKYLTKRFEAKSRVNIN